MVIKHIEGFKDYYVSNDGRVFSKKWGYMKEISQRFEKSTKRYRVHLRSGDKRFLMDVHRLVGLAFLPKSEGRNMVLHCDGNALNNHISNLRWGNAHENKLDEFKHLGKGVLNWETVDKIRCMDSKGVESVEISKKLELNYKIVRNVLLGRNWLHKNRPKDSTMKLKYEIKDEWMNGSKSKPDGHKGENHPKSKLTWEKVRKIRRSKLNLRQMSELMGVSISTISLIRKNKTWKEQ